MASARGLDGPVAAQAMPLGVVLGVATVLGGLLGGAVWGIPLALLTAAHFAFFRNPRRAIPPGDGCVVSPADGRVVEIDYLDDPFVGRCVRVAIFLSVFNVHINRMPLAAKVRARTRSGSLYLAAFHRRASSQNVQARLDLETPSGMRFAVSQITGLIARRIVCFPEEGDVLQRGAAYGLIHYGSRVELYLPADARLRVERGARVRGGSTVMAEVGA